MNKEWKDYEENPENYQTMEECRESIFKIAERIKLDASSKFLNSQKVRSMRALLDLYEYHNSKL